MKMMFVSFVIISTLLFIPTILSADVTNGSAEYGYLTPMRLRALVAGVVGLASVVIGGLSLVRSRRAGYGRAGAIVGGVAGLIGILLAVLHLLNSSGGFGTGNGRAGAIVAILVGLAGIILAGLTWVRSRRNG